MPEPSETLADWELVVRTVSSAIDEHDEEFAAELAAKLFPDGVPENLTLLMVIRAAGAYLGRELAVYRVAETALLEERSDDPPLRKERKKARDALRAKISSVRSLVEGAHGTSAAARTGLGTRLPDDDDALVQMAETAAGRLEKTDLGAPTTGQPLDRAGLADDLRLHASRFRAALDATVQEGREENDAMHERDVAEGGLSRAYSGVADMTVGVATIAGRDDIADGVRPTWRRRDGRPEEEDLRPAGDADPTPAGPATDTDTPA